MNTLYVDTKKMMLKSLLAMTMLLEKVQMQVAGRGHTEQDLLDSHLAPDMFPFSRQIQIMSDNAKGAMARLSGVEVPSMPDTEASLGDLVQRLKKTATFVSETSEEELQKADERKITLPYYPGKFQNAEDYVRDFAIPNFYFHFVTAYAILRMKGYSVGKGDFIGGLNLRDL